LHAFKSFAALANGGIQFLGTVQFQSQIGGRPARGDRQSIRCEKEPPAKGFGIILELVGEQIYYRIYEVYTTSGSLNQLSPSFDLERSILPDRLNVQSAAALSTTEPRTTANESPSLSGPPRCPFHQADDSTDGMMMPKIHDRAITTFVAHLCPCSNTFDGRRVASEHEPLRAAQRFADSSPIPPEHGRGGNPYHLFDYRGKLWGMIACHHRRPWSLPFALRQDCQSLGQVTAPQIGTCAVAATQAYRFKRTEILARFLEQIAATGDFAAGLTQHQAKLQDYIESTGAAIIFDDVCTTLGSVPDDAALMKLRDWLIASSKEQLFVTHLCPWFTRKPKNSRPWPAGCWRCKFCLTMAATRSGLGRK
jgi:hypothetical protein